MLPFAHEFADALCWVLRLIPCYHGAKLHVGDHHENLGDHVDLHCCTPGRLRAGNANGGIPACAPELHALADRYRAAHGDAHADFNRAAPNAHAQPHIYGDAHYLSHGNFLAYGDDAPYPNGHASAAEGDGHPPAAHPHALAGAHFAHFNDPLRVGAGGDAG